MAIQNFIEGSLYGKIGGFVGANWRGIDYMRSYAKPKQPDSPAQVLHKQNFKRLITVANNLHKTWFPLVFDDVPNKTLSNQFMTLNKGIYQTDGIQYHLKFPHKYSDLLIYGSTHDYGPNYMISTRALASGSFEGTVENLLTLMYCPEKYECAYEITHALPSAVNIRFPSVWTGCRVYTYSQLITSAGIYDARVYDWGIWQY